MTATNPTFKPPTPAPRSRSQRDSKVQRDAKLAWVPIPEMQVSPRAQRDYNPARVEKLVREMNLERLGTPTVNRRDGAWWIIDGQHRIEALRDERIGYGDQQVECWTYQGMSEADEADMFLTLNDNLTVSVFSKFKVAVTAGHAVECDIARIVEEARLKIALGGGAHSISAVGTLRKLYNYSPETLARTLCIIRDAFGGRGFNAQILSGVGLVCSRYNGDLSDDKAVRGLIRYGKNDAGALVAEAKALHFATRNAQEQCIAAVVVKWTNGAGGRGKKLPDWWA